MKDRFLSAGLVLIMLVTVLFGCGEKPSEETASTSETTVESGEATEASDSILFSTNAETVLEETTEAPGEFDNGGTLFDVSLIPAYSDKLYVSINENRPFFGSDEITAHSFENYSELDSLNRCGSCVACLGRDLMPTEERDDFLTVNPSGWHSVKYDCVNGSYLYNRSHLIGYQLTGKNSYEKNLITLTAYANVEGMLPFENMTADYIKETDNHVMYRVTPIFEGSDLVCRGVLMEALSVEDGGDGLCFCVFVYNVQPGVEIDYSSGASAEIGLQPETDPETSEVSGDYVINKNSKKFHYPYCSSVKKMKESNKQYYTGPRSTLINNGYSPCKNCNP